MNMTKLARLCNVSVSTVSKAFAKNSEISEKKREEIFKIARENGCYDKYCKGEYQGLVVGVIVSEFRSKYYAQQLSCLEKEIRRRGGIMLVGSSNFDPLAENEIVTYFSEFAKVDGIISLEKLENEKRLSVPCVAIGKHKYAHSVILSIEPAVDEAILYLKNNGHKSIAFIGEQLTKGKREIFVKSMEKHKLPIKAEYIVEGGGRFEKAGYNAMSRLFEQKELPTAVICAYDNIAIGAMKCINEHGKKIPEDISIIGFNDIEELPYLGVPLTSITSHNEDLCQIIVELLFDVMKNKGKQKTIKVSKQLVIRASSGKAR